MQNEKMLRRSNRSQLKGLVTIPRQGKRQQGGERGNVCELSQLHSIWEASMEEPRPAHLS